MALYDMINAWDCADALVEHHDESCVNVLASFPYWAKLRSHQKLLNTLVLLSSLDNRQGQRHCAVIGWAIQEAAIDGIQFTPSHKETAGILLRP